jgi:hypothetical protein
VVQLLTLSIGVIVGGIVMHTQPNALFHASVAPGFSRWVVDIEQKTRSHRGVMV